MKNIYAYTGQSPAKGYVGYISINQRGNEIEISVRTEGENPQLGYINLTPEQCEAMACDLLAHINGEPSIRTQLTEAQAEVERLKLNASASVNEYVTLERESARLREALDSIAKNTCCDRCQEAAKFARAALESKT
jgi:hypothetical protein